MKSTQDDLSNLDLSAPAMGSLNPSSPSITTTGPVTASVAGVSTPEVEDEAEGELEEQKFVSRWAWLAIPAWLVSMLIHVAILLFMAAYHIPGVGDAISGMIMTASPSEDAPEALEEFAMESAQAVEAEQDPSEVIPSSTPVLNTAISEVSVDVKLEAMVAPAMANLSLPSMSDSLSSAMLSSGATSATKSLSSRGKVAKRELLERYGGNEDTEKAVAAALKFFAQHQLADGSWSFVHSLACKGQCTDVGKVTAANAGATGLVLMSFLGAGQNHIDGEYKEVVGKGLAYLIKSMRVTGKAGPSWYTNGQASKSGAMYTHGIAAIAMCEAYGMTKDPQLKQAAQLSLDFISVAQSPTGGWHYAAGAPTADTSVVGWQLMALKSGSMSGLAFPTKTLVNARRYLDSVQSEDGTIYGYSKKGDRKGIANAMTACGILCRMYMGMPKDSPALDKVAQAFIAKGPIPSDIYFNYYGTQVMKQVGGPRWDQWNQKMLKFILPTQEKSGHMAGSWMEGKNSHSGETGGRLYVTAMSTMILEVYYRYMPLYGEQTEEEAFKL
jgi:hypothetical protein